MWMQQFQQLGKLTARVAGVWGHVAGGANRGGGGGWGAGAPPGPLRRCRPVLEAGRVCRPPAGLQQHLVLAAPQGFTIIPGKHPTYVGMPVFWGTQESLAYKRIRLLCNLDRFVPCSILYQSSKQTMAQSVLPFQFSKGKPPHTRFVGYKECNEAMQT